MSSFNFTQDLLIENSKLRLENNKILKEFNDIKKILLQIQADVSELKNRPVTVVERTTPVVSKPDLHTPIKNSSVENRSSLFIPTPDMDGLKDSISKVSKKKRRVNFDDAISKLKDMESGSEQNK